MLFFPYCFCKLISMMSTQLIPPLHRWRLKDMKNGQISQWVFNPQSPQKQSLTVSQQVLNECPMVLSISQRSLRAFSKNGKFVGLSLISLCRTWSLSYLSAISVNLTVISQGSLDELSMSTQSTPWSLQDLYRRPRKLVKKMHFDRTKSAQGSPKHLHRNKFFLGVLVFSVFYLYLMW